MVRAERLMILELEDRLAPAVGDLLHTMAGSSSGNNFGRAVAADGDLVVTTGGGKGFVYNSATGALVSTLQVSGTGIRGFGSAAAISGNRVVVSAPASTIGSIGDAGAVFVFDATTGTLVSTINHPTPSIEDNFGYDVDIDGDRVVVGTLNVDSGDRDKEDAAYLFDATSGNLLATFTNPTGDEDDSFGYSVAVSGTRVVIGSPYTDPSGLPISSGSVYVFDAAGGAPVATLRSPQPQGAGGFGVDVAVDGNNLLVGEFQVKRAEFETVGGAYAYDLTDPAAPVLRASFDSPAPEPGQRFGAAVAVSGNQAVIGMGRDDAGAIDIIGSAYAYDLSSASPTVPLATLGNPSGAIDRYGSRVAVGGGRAVVGASLADPGNVRNAGAMYVFDVGGGGGASPPPPPPPPPPASPPIASFATGGGTNGVVEVARSSGMTTVDTGIGRATRTATADVTGDGVLDTIAGAGPGGASRVVVIDGATGGTVAGFDVFEGAFTGGLFVAAADLNGDGKAEVIVTPDRGGGPVVAIYNGAGLAAGANADSQLVRFFGIEDPNFRGGARAAAGDVNGDERADLLVAAGFGGGPRLAVFEGRRVLDPVAPGETPPKLFGDFFVFEETLRNGVFVAAGDLTGDAAAEVVVGGGPGGGPRVLALDGRALVNGNQTTVANFFAGDPALRGGVRVAVRSDADGSVLVTGSGDGEEARVRAYRAATARAGGNPDQELTPFGGAVLLDGVFVG